jgi:RNA polymerase-associated protein
MLKPPSPASTTLYSYDDDLKSHVVRFIMAEKFIEADIINTVPEKMPEEVLILNPYKTLPVLFDRGQVLYELSVIYEYLDERFPFPRLLPIDLIDKAEKRLLIFRFTNAKDSWYELVKIIQTEKAKKANEARKILKSELINLVPLFAYKPYFKSDTMTMADVCLAPILWRLKRLDIDLGNKAKPIYDYAERIFKASGFEKSLTDKERNISPFSS